MAIVNAPEPKNTQELQSFLGLLWQVYQESVEHCPPTESATMQGGKVGVEPRVSEGFPGTKVQAEF